MDDGARLVGRYRIVRQIGRGGMAVVYLADQPDLDRQVALKELGQFSAGDPATLARFVQESRLAGSFNHPNIVTVYDYFEHDGVPFIAMEYLERGSLRPCIGRTTSAQTIGVLEGALAGLAQAERSGIVHRDMKPENLMVTDEGAVKIADFGIAKALSEAAGHLHLTATGTTIGTPAYMAPEQATATDIGPWTDLYSLGVIAYELVAGRVPFHDSTTPVAVLLRQVSEEIPPVRSIDPSVDRSLSDWIDRLLVKDPARRTQSAREAWLQLEEIAVSILGPLWRRDARLPDEGAGARAPLTPAPFSGTATASPVTASHATAAETSAAATDPRATETMSAPVSGETTTAAVAEDTVQVSGHRGGGARTRGRLIATVVIAAAAAAAIAIAVLPSRGGSGARHASRPALHEVPTVKPRPAGFVPGTFSGAVSFDGQPWAVRNGNSLVDLSDPTRAVVIGAGARAVAAGDGALWVSRDLSKTSSELDRVVPGAAIPIQRRIPIDARVNGIRPVIAGGNAWQLLATGGLLRISLRSSAATIVQGMPDSIGSLAAAGGAVWATGHAGTVARISTAQVQPRATLIPLAGAGWIAPAGNAVYVADATGVSRLTETGTPVPVVGVTTRPDRLSVVGRILWMSFYPSGAGPARIQALELGGHHRAGAAVAFQPATGQPPSRLDAIGGAFWISVVRGGGSGGAGENGVQPFTIGG